jgi:hypothetical protein
LSAVEDGGVKDRRKAREAVAKVREALEKMETGTKSV